MLPVWLVSRLTGIQFDLGASLVCLSPSPLDWLDKSPSPLGVYNSVCPPPSMISSNDRAVLNSIFNPLLPSAEFYQEESDETLEGEEEESEGLEESRGAEGRGVEAAERGDLAGAVQLFTAAVLAAPSRPSPYNNRAQAHRLNNNDKEAMADLCRAIELSGGRGRAGRAALCQRGLLHRRDGNVDQAKKDFQQAADQGSAFAKQQLVEMNPYAAMCNQMLHDMMSALKQEKPEINEGA